MKYLLGIFVLLMFTNVFAVCENGQVDINSASLEELDKIVWVGPSTAEKIISARPFNNLKELTKVSGIAEGKLENITKQGLACVEEEVYPEKTSDTKTSQEEDENDDKKRENLDEELAKNVKLMSVQEESDEKVEMIKLVSEDTKDIKSENDTKNLDSLNYAKYGFVGFCILLALLFILKKPKVQGLD